MADALEPVVSAACCGSDEWINLPLMSRGGRAMRMRWLESGTTHHLRATRTTTPRAQDTGAGGRAVGRWLNSEWSGHSARLLVQAVIGRDALRSLYTISAYRISPSRVRVLGPVPVQTYKQTEGLCKQRHQSEAGTTV